MDVVDEPDNDSGKILDSQPRRARSGGLPLIRYLVANEQYLLTEKAYDPLTQGCFELEDLEHSVQCGTVVKTENDEHMDSVGNKKYTIIGPDRFGYPFYSVGKIKKVQGRRKYLVITAHHAEANYE